MNIYINFLKKKYMLLPMIKVCVIGLGYVGLPICLRSSYKFKTFGFDTNKLRIKNLNKKFDQNNEYKKKDFSNKNLTFTDKIYKIKNCNFFIICVPTPIKKNNNPDLGAVENSFNTISKICFMSINNKICRMNVVLNSFR